MAQSGIEVILKNVAFKKRVRSYIFKNLEYKDLLPFFQEAEQIFITKTREVLLELPNVKCNLLLEAKFSRPNSAAKNQTKSNEGENTNKISDDQVENFYIQSKMKDISPTTQLNNWFKKMWLII